MALSSSKTVSAIKSNINGFDFDNPHNKSAEFIQAAVNGVIDILTSKALVVVPPHAGGSYSIAGVVDYDIESAIKGYMTSFVFTGTHSKAGTQPKAVGKAIATVISNDAKVDVPTDTSGSFPILNVTSSAIKSLIEAQYIADGFKLGNEHCQSLKVIDALSTALADAISNDAKVPANGVSGGPFKVI